MEAGGLWSYFEWAENLKLHKSVCVSISFLCLNDMKEPIWSTFNFIFRVK